jgi:hypothetical protein
MIDPQWLDLDNTIAKVVKVLDDLEIRYVFTGGVAVITYGDPRTTNDVDLVLKIPPEERDIAETLVRELSDAFHVNLVACREALHHKTMFQAIDKENVFKVDFHVSEMIPRQFERCVPQELATGRVIPMVSPEDSVLSKLVWIKMGSDRSRRDVIGILKMQKKLDTDYLETTAKQLGVEQILNELKILAESNDPNIIF